MSASVAETFEELVRHQPLAATVAFLVQLDKKDVPTVRLKTKALYKLLNDWQNPDAKLLRPREAHLFLAGLATYTKQEALGRNFGLPWQFQLDRDQHQENHRELFLTVLRHSRPGWLAAWFERGARDNSWRTAPYRLLRQLHEENLLGYEPWLMAQGLAHWLNGHNHDNRGKAQGYEQHLLRQLQADTVLLTRDLPLLFEYDTPADSAAVYRGGDQPGIGWVSLLPPLAASGHLDREALLTRCLLALRRDFRRPLLTWFKSLFVALQPTPAERLARQTELGELLAHALPLVVNFALDQLKDLWASPELEAAPLLQFADGLLTRPDLKTGLKALLAGFEKLLKRSPALAPTLARLAAGALTQADTDVQARAARLLAAMLQAKKPVLNAAEAAEATEAIAQYADLLAPAARATLAPWLATASAPTEAAPMAGYVPLQAFGPDISAATAIVPVADWHELLFLTGRVLAGDDPATWERWLDGLLGLRGQFPADYSQQVLPYVKQAFPWVFQDRTVEEARTMALNYQFGEYDNRYTQLQLALLIGWFTGFEGPQVTRLALAGTRYNTSDPLLQVEQQRLAAAEAHLRAGRSLPLLSTPTHAPHWVAPTALLHKLLAYEAAQQQPDPADLALALARLAWATETDAAQARLQLPQLQSAGLRPLLAWVLAPAAAPAPLPPLAAHQAMGGLLRSLGQKLGLVAEPSPTNRLAAALPWLWVVAARTRYPQAVLDELRPLANYPGVATPWQPGWHLQSATRTDKRPWNKAQPEVTYTWQELLVPTAQPATRPPSPLLLYSLHAQLPGGEHSYLWSLPVTLPFLLTLLPNNPAPLHWHLLRTACRTDEEGKSSAGRDVMQLVQRSLLAAGPAFDESASLLLATGLVHAAPTVRALALEALLAATDHGRLEPVLLGAALGRLLAAEFAPVARLADGLAQVRAIAPATDDALCQTLEALLPELSAAPPRNTAKLLAAYADLVARTQRPVPAAVQARLCKWQAIGSLKKAIALVA